MRRDARNAFFAALVGALVTSGCADGREAGTDDDQASGAGEPDAVTIGEDLAARGDDGRVRLEGVYQGFMAGECRFPAGLRSESLTRSDWLLRQGEVCVYVTGGYPPGVEPLSAADVGSALSVVGEIRRDAEDRVYLDYVEAELQN